MNDHVPSPADTGALHLHSIRWMLHTAHRFSKPAAGRWCYRVLARPPRKKFTPAESYFLAEAEQHTVHVSRMRIRLYHWTGKGPKILLAHGWNSHSGRWYRLGQQLLQQGYDIYAIDAPAHGKSVGGSFALVYYAQAMAEVVNLVQPSKIIGHSAGGMATIHYLHHEPEAARPSQVALLATPAELTHFMDSFQRILGLRKEIMQALEREFVRRFNRTFDYFSPATFVKHLDLPGLIIHDEHDDVAPVQGAHTLANAWSGSELQLTQGLGHSVEDEKVYNWLLDWLES